MTLLTIFWHFCFSIAWVRNVWSGQFLQPRFCLRPQACSFISCLWNYSLGREAWNCFCGLPGLVWCFLLFTDACRTDLRALKDIRNLPGPPPKRGNAADNFAWGDHCVGNVSARRHIGRYPGHQNAIPTCASRYFLRKYFMRSVR